MYSCAMIRRLQRWLSRYNLARGPVGERSPVYHTPIHVFSPGSSLLLHSSGVSLRMLTDIYMEGECYENRDHDLPDAAAYRWPNRNRTGPALLDPQFPADDSYSYAG